MATLHLAPLDWAVVAVFVLAILGLGFSARLRESTVLQYLAAGRSLSLTAFVATLVSTWYGGILGVGESVKYFGAGTWLLVGMPYYVFGLAYAVWLAPRIRQEDQISIPERLALRWGRANGVLGALFIFLLAVPAAHVLMLGVLLQQITGLDRSLAVGIAGLIGVALLFRGGLLADVRVSLLAFCLMYLGFGLMVLFCVSKYPGAIQTIPDKQLLTFTGGQSWTVILSFFILGAWTIVDPAFHQRVASAASPSVGRRGLVVSVLFWFIFDLLSISAALYALALVDPNLDKLAIYPALAEKVLPPGVKGLFLCGIAGTVATAMVSYTLVSGATIGRECVARIFGPFSDARVTGFIKVGLFLAIALAIPIGLTLNSVVDLWYAWAGVSVGALLIPMLVAYRQEASRIRRGWVFAAMFLAGTSAMGWLIFCQRTNNSTYDVVLLNSGNGWRLALPPIPQGWQGTAASFSLGTLLPGLVISAVIPKRRMDRRYKESQMTDNTQTDTLIDNADEVGEHPHAGVSQEGWSSPLQDAQIATGCVGSLVLKRDGAESDISFPVNPPAVIGRFDPSVGPIDIDLGSLEPEGVYISRKHAKIVCEDDVWKIVDLGSSNGTFVLRSDFEKVEEAELSDGTEIAFGNARFVFTWSTAERIMILR